ncbi:MAG: hypothetical protein E6L04_03850 [Thaumarchaeota archaeon]|nr:MAG: hypothetical protein E6L04_03850 [Nitrososphaerota archaeon]
MVNTMTYPKGYSGGGGGGRSSDEVEHMIGRRVENMRGIFIIGFILCWAATAGGVYVGITVYPWAYPLPSGLYALSVLTVIESLGFFWIMKISRERLGLLNFEGK